jgi:RNA polymerase sigma factor (sigma-70 family)
MIIAADLNTTNFELLHQAQRCVSALPESATPAQRYEYRLGQRAYSTLVEQYHDYLYHQIHRIRPAVDLDEAFSIALEGLRRAVESFDFSTPFLNWLKIKVRGALLDANRTAVRSKLRADEIKQITQLDYQESPKEFEPNTVQPGLEAYLHTLTAVQQKLLSLHAQGVSWAEIGEWLGTSAAAARRRFVRLRDSMLRALTPKIEPQTEGQFRQQLKRSPIVERLTRCLELEPAQWLALDTAGVVGIKVMLTQSILLVSTRLGAVMGGVLHQTLKRLRQPRLLPVGGLICSDPWRLFHPCRTPGPRLNHQTTGPLPLIQTALGVTEDSPFKFWIIKRLRVVALILVATVLDRSIRNAKPPPTQPPDFS